MPALVSITVLAALAYLLWRVLSRLPRVSWAERAAAAETWDQLGGPGAPALRVSDRVSTWTVGGKLRRWVPAVQDGLVTIVADENVMVLINNKAHPTPRRCFLRTDPTISFSCRKAFLGGQLLAEEHSGATLDGSGVGEAVEGLRSLGWVIREHAEHSSSTAISPRRRHR